MRIQSTGRIRQAVVVGVAGLGLLSGGVACNSGDDGEHGGGQGSVFGEDGEGGGTGFGG